MTDTVTMTTPGTTAAPAARASGRTLARGIAFGTGMAVAANLVIFLLGDLGAPVQVVKGGSNGPVDLSAVEVVVVSVIWLAIGAAALWLFERRAGGFRNWAVLAAAVTVGTIVPLLRLDIDAGSKLTLSVMHLVVGAAAVAGQALARRP